MFKGNRKNISLRNRDYFKKLMELYKERALVYIAYLDIANALAKTREKKETLEQEILKLGENMHKKRCVENNNKVKYQNDTKIKKSFREECYL